MSNKFYYFLDGLFSTFLLGSSKSRKSAIELGLWLGCSVFTGELVFLLLGMGCVFFTYLSRSISDASYVRINGSGFLFLCKSLYLLYVIKISSLAAKASSMIVSLGFSLIVLLTFLSHSLICSIISINKALSLTLSAGFVLSII